MVFVNRKSVTFPKIVQKHGGRKQEPWQPGGLRWSQQGTLGTAAARGGGSHGRTRPTAARRAQRRESGGGAAAGIGHRGGPRALPLPRGRNRPDSPASCYRRFEVLRGRILGRAFRGRGS